MTTRSFDFPDKKLPILIQQDLERFAKQWKSEESIGAPEPIDAFCDVMLRGGKRLRGMLAMQSYYAHGGTGDAVALGAARVFEIIQTSLLLVDDIADRSPLRRGGLSAHVRITEYARQYKLKGSARHFGEVQTMNVAYAGLHQATIELLNLPVDAEIARRACRQFHKNILITVNGQVDDIFNEATVELASEASIESVLIRKSAYYTILSPIELGASLAGSTYLPKSLQNFSIHIGCAFQIADDIISTFGHENETGKGTNDDIREGKLTLLSRHALARSNTTQKEALQTHFGKINATNDECDVIRDIFIATGALTHAKTRMHFHEREALKALDDDSTTTPEFLTYLAKLANYVVNRGA